MRSFLLVLLTLFAVVPCARGQQGNPVKSGVAEGILTDSVSGKGLASGTVSIYKVKDSSLVIFQLSATNGSFRFDLLPVSVPLELVISFMGYRRYIRHFTLAPQQKYDLGRIGMVRSDISLKEFTVAPERPPVQMNGDTLEFNADAFSMDKNAVVEDLLKRLPGVTVWGDGKITVFGKTVNNVLVDGKPFFGRDGTIATQNLPKNAVDKVQVYTDRDNQRSEQDSVMSVNIKLKKDKNSGYFGKIGAGYGTGNRYTADAMLSGFTPRSQLSIAGALNNINVTAPDVTTLMRNSSFKGVGINIEYQPNFDMEGLHKTTSAGLTFQHDFIPDPGPMKNNRIDGNYFLTNQQNEVLKNTVTRTTLNGDSALLNISRNTMQGTNRNQIFNANYGVKNETGEYYLSHQIALNDMISLSEQAGEVTNEKGIQRSINNSVFRQDRNSRDIIIKAGLNNINTMLKLDYILTLNRTHDRQLNKTEFHSLSDQELQAFFNRQYDNRSSLTSNELNARYALSKALWGDNKFWGTGLSLINEFKWDVRKENNIVGDLDTLQHSYAANNYLTNEMQTSNIDEKPGISLNRRFAKTFTNRYRKVWWVALTGQEQFFSQKNVAVKSYQNFSRTYTVFLPSASLLFENEQISDHRTSYTLKYSKRADYPTAGQLVPLIDSSNVYYQRMGNSALSPEVSNQLSLSIFFFSFRTNKLFDNYSLDISAGTVNNAFTDSSFYQPSGRTVSYTINRSGARFLRIDGNFYRAVKLDGHQFQIVGKASAMLNERPRYINAVLIRTSSLFGQGSVNVLYTCKDLFAFNIAEAVNVVSSGQSGAGGSMKNVVYKTTLSSSINLPARLTLSSNITFNHTTSTYLPARNFRIWNASLAWRLLEGNQGEVKFTAMDLLHQNNSVLNIGNYNAITTGTVNVLQQYFMLTVSYFPRKFGKRVKKR